MRNSQILRLIVALGDILICKCLVELNLLSTQAGSGYCVNSQSNLHELRFRIEEIYKTLRDYNSKRITSESEHELFELSVEIFLLLNRIYTDKFNWDSRFRRQIEQMSLELEIKLYDKIHGIMPKEHSLEGLSLSKTDDIEVARLMLELGFAEKLEDIYVEHVGRQTYRTIDQRKDREKTSKVDERHSLEGLHLSKTSDIQVAQLMLELGFVSKLEDIYQSA